MPSSLEILSSELDQDLEAVLTLASTRHGNPGWLAAEAFIVLAHAVEITDDVLAAKSLCESAEPLSHVLQVQGRTAAMRENCLIRSLLFLQASLLCLLMASC